MKAYTTKRVYMVGANPCKLDIIFESKKEAKEYCKHKNSKAKKYTYEVKSFDLVLDVS